MDVDVRNSEVQRELLAQYRRLREIAKRLNDQLVESLDKDAIHESGRRLGILRRGVLVFDSEDMASVLMDYGIHHYLSGDGRNAVRRYLDLSPPGADTEEYAVLQAKTNLRYGLFQVAGVLRGFGIEVDDLLRRERLLLIDVGFGSTARRGFVIASNVVCYGSFWTTTGAGLPVSADVLKELSGLIARAFGTTPEGFLALDPAQQADLATLVIRTCLQRGMGEHVAYGEPGSHSNGPHFGRAPEHALGPTGLVAARSQQRQERRNAPCPCDSGRKYKNCCGRR
jgi:hypothetical protein